MTSLLEKPHGAAPDEPGRRSAFRFETITRLPRGDGGKGRNGARYGLTGIVHTPHGDILTPAFVPVPTLSSMNAVLPEALKALGAQCLLSTASHPFVSPDPDLLS